MKNVNNSKKKKIIKKENNISGKELLLELDKRLSEFAKMSYNNGYLFMEWDNWSIYYITPSYADKIDIFNEKELEALQQLKDDTWIEYHTTWQYYLLDTTKWVINEDEKDEWEGSGVEEDNINGKLYDEFDEKDQERIQASIEDSGNIENTQFYIFDMIIASVIGKRKFILLQNRYDLKDKIDDFYGSGKYSQATICGVKGEGYAQTHIYTSEHIYNLLWLENIEKELETGIVIPFINEKIFDELYNQIWKDYEETGINKASMLDLIQSMKIKMGEIIKTTYIDILLDNDNDIYNDNIESRKEYKERIDKEKFIKNNPDEYFIINRYKNHIQQTRFINNYLLLNNLGENILIKEEEYA